MLWYEKIMVAVLAVFAFCLACVPCLLVGLLYYFTMWNNPDVNPKARGAEVYAQCPPGGCPDPRKVPGQGSPLSSPAYRWVAIPDDDDQTALYDGNRYVGNWSERWGYFRPIVGNGWGDPCRPPIKPPVRVLPTPVAPTFAPGSRDAKADPFEEQLRAMPELVAAQVADELPTGVDLDRIGKGAEYVICDDKSCRPISRRAAIEAIENGVPDDSGKLRLTIIGTPEDRKRVEAELAQVENADIKAAVNVWSVEPNHWSVADVGFKTDGKPTIYLQRPDGKVLGRDDSFEGKPTIEAIRKRVNAYDASKDLRIKVEPTVRVDIPWVPFGIFGGIIAGAVILAKGGNRS